ncbi:WD40 repeat domain-containing protein [Spirulina subsalsa]|uniref:WD40 repeat domain-containing protein n=1 Tax=Spirulina subsalsa TaxID=54311 RepID=UPI0002E8546B|nr:WD40 repeat domain-containing protein [Spirulina subsalsa]
MVHGQPQQPRDFDVVMGSQSVTPETALVLGGLEGVRRRVSSPVVESRKMALQEALKYGKGGLELIISALYDESEQVQRVAYQLLRYRTEGDVLGALRAYLPYHLFEEQGGMRVGRGATVDGLGRAIAHLKGKTLEVLDIATREVLYSLPRQRNERLFLCSPDCLIRVIQQKNARIEVWEEGELKWEFSGHQGRIDAMAFSPEQQILATGGSDTVIRLWNLKTGKLVGTLGKHLVLGAHSDRIFALQFSPTGNTLISSSQDGTLKLWDLRTRDRPRTLHTYTLHFALSPDELTLVTTDWSGNLAFWDLSLQKIQRTIAVSYTHCLTFTPYGRILITAGGDRMIHFWNPYTAELIHSLSGHHQNITSLILTAQGQQLISLGQDNELKIWAVLEQ